MAKRPAILLLLVVVGLVGAACGQNDDRASMAATTGVGEGRLPDPPISIGETPVFFGSPDRLFLISRGKGGMLKEMAVYDVEAGSWAEAADPPRLIASAHGWALDHVTVVGITGCDSLTTCSQGRPSAWNYSPSDDRWTELETGLAPVDIENEWSVEDPVVRGTVAFFPFSRRGLLIVPKSGRATSAPRLADGIYWNVCASQDRIVSLVTPDGRTPDAHVPYAPNTVELRSRPASATARESWERPANPRRPASVGATEIYVNACTGDGGILTDNQGQASYWSAQNGGGWQNVTPAGFPPRETVFGGAIAADGDAVLVGENEVFRLDTDSRGVPSAWTSAPLPRGEEASGPVLHLQAVAANRVFILALPSQVAGANPGDAGEPSIHEVRFP